MLQEKSYFENLKIGLRFSTVERRAPGAPQKKPLDIENSLGYPPRGSPAAAAERVY